jgi:hypothetical protein
LLEEWIIESKVSLLEAYLRKYEHWTRVILFSELSELRQGHRGLHSNVSYKHGWESLRQLERGRTVVVGLVSVIDSLNASSNETGATVSPDGEIVVN